MRHKTAPPRRRIHTLRHRQSFRYRQPASAFGSPDSVASGHTAPRVIAHTLTLSDSNQAHPHRIEMNIIHQRTIVVGRGAFIQNSLLAVPEKPPPKPMTIVKPARVSVLEPFHSGHEIAFRCFDHQMVMV